MCEVHYSAAEDSNLTIRQIRIINANARKQCAAAGLLRDCRSLIK